MSARRTSTSNVARTAAATAERRRRHVRQLLERFLWTIGELSDEQLAATILTLGEELQSRPRAAEIRRGVTDFDEAV